MGRIKMKQVEGLGKVTIEMAVEEFLKHCRLRNLSPKTIRYYEEDLRYFARNISAANIEEINRETLDEFILLEMDKGNRVTAINSRLRGIRVFIHFCAEREYTDDFRCSLLKEDERLKDPYTDEELRRLLKRPMSDSWTEWRTWAAINTFLATGVRASKLLSIRITDLDFEQNTVLLTKLKNRKQQMIPISKTLKDIHIREYREGLLYECIDGEYIDLRLDTGIKPYWNENTHYRLLTKSEA